MFSKSDFVCALGGLVLTVALPSGVALAHGDQDKTNHAHAAAPAESVQGTVEAVTHKDMTVKDSTGKSMKVQFNKSTQYDNSGKSGSASDLRAGMAVTIDCAKQKDGSLRATAIRYDKSAPTAS